MATNNPEITDLVDWLMDTFEKIETEALHVQGAIDRFEDDPNDASLDGVWSEYEHIDQLMPQVHSKLTALRSLLPKASTGQ